MGVSLLRDAAFVLDAVVVGISIMDLFRGFLPNLGVLRVLRVLRLAKLTRLLKAVKMLKAFGTLRVLITAISGCVPTLIWSGIIVGMVMLGFSIFVAEILQPWILDESNDDE